MLLNELFNRPAEYGIMTATANTFKAAFAVNDRTIVFLASRNSDDCWYISFYQMGEMTNPQIHSMTNDGGEFDVMSTVKKLMDELIARYNPTEILFSADRTEESRVRLYTKMVARYLPPNYERVERKKSSMDDDYEMFSFRRKQ